MWKNVGYYNGEIGPLEEMKVPMGDRALYCWGLCVEEGEAPWTQSSQP